VIVRARFREVEQQVETATAPSAEARLLALTYAIEEAVEDGQFGSVADVARSLGVTRARLSQVMRRRWASVDEQQQILRDRGRVASDRARSGSVFFAAATGIA
jgi:Arc/MetJ-type ribon-helix-helix transcriptional regulator